ncbi:MAG: AmmeMemoRadiSam system protein B [Planctomycetota bacterium]
MGRAPFSPSFVRPAAFAGRFYPGSPEACAQMAAECLRGAAAPPAVGAVVPHAGWVYSGAVAAKSLAGIAAFRPDTVVIFGAVHGLDRNRASLWPRGAWQTPLGELEVDEDLARRFAEDAAIVSDLDAHRYEHSIEVQLPLLKRLLPDVRIVPIGVRPGLDAAEIGRVCADKAGDYDRRVAWVGSTDLTHYGPAFGFEPYGRGAAGVRWAKEVNDRRFIALVQQLQAEALVAEAAEHHNACGPGAIAALLAAMRAIRATRYTELEHTCSADVKLGADADRADSVGYEAGVFLAPERFT